jgi:hypothetical protein
MGTVMGFVLGYMLGTKAGDEGYKELRAAWATISSSEEVRDILAGGLSTLGELLSQGRSLLADRLAPGAGQGLRAA